MPVISPVRGLVMNAERIQWSGIASSDTFTEAGLAGQSGAIGSVQITGTFGSASVTLQGSNDGTNFVTLKSTSGADVSMTAAGLVDFSTAAAFIRPAISGAGGSNIAVTVVLRG